MNNFTVIYRILKALEAAMDSDEFDAKAISPERLKVSENRRNRLLIQLYEAGYIANVHVKKYVDDVCPTVYVDKSTTITLKGLEYLEENSLMSKAKDFVKEIKDFIPGI